MKLWDLATITYLIITLISIYGILLYGYVCFKRKRMDMLDIYSVVFFGSYILICLTNIIVRAFIYYNVDKVKYIETYLHVLNRFWWPMRWWPLLIILSIYLYYRTKALFRYYKNGGSIEPFSPHPNRRIDDV